jgi:glycosyltransferase involved in cell wall biosynthesis
MSTQGRRPLSVVIITLNEEEVLARCLHSVQGLAQEVVVLDSGSTDGTRRIAEEHGARFYYEAWKGYSEQKNRANEMARHDWVLSLDADEEVTPQLRKAIEQVLDGPEEKKLYQLRRTMVYCGRPLKHTSLTGDIQTRLFNRHRTRWSGIVHESLEMPLGHQHAMLAGRLMHYSFRSIEQHAATTVKYAGLAAKKTLAKGRKVFLFELFYRPPIAFFKQYVMKKGFLEGYYGYVISKLAAQSVWLKYSIARGERIKQKQA